MLQDAIVLFVVYTVVLSVLAIPLGKWIAYVLSGKLSRKFPILSVGEGYLGKGCGLSSLNEMNWRQYLGAAILFNLVGVTLLWLMLLVQGYLPMNPGGAENMRWDIALNTAISFMTNTNWQFYSGEGKEGISYLVQMLGLGVQNFLSCATSFAVMAAFARGIGTYSLESKLGNFWVDVTRVVVYILLPISFVTAIVLISQGVVQNFNAPVLSQGLDGVTQMIPGGPAASQIAIKQLGSNGGGFFGINSCHPLENPTGLSNFIEMQLLLLLAAASPLAFGWMMGRARQGWIIWGAMTIMFIAVLSLSYWSEYQGNPDFTGLVALEGKEVRFGQSNSLLWSIATTCASNGSVNCMHSSLSPLSGGIALLNMLLGEIIYGGAGCGLYGMVLFAIVSVFLCGLMVGRTPEFLGKKIQAKEMSWSMVGIISPAIIVLICSSLALMTNVGRETLSTSGAHAVTEVLYCFGSQAGNNGSAFAGLGVGETPFYALLGSVCLLVGRFCVMIPVLIIAGSMQSKRIAPPAMGTMSTENTTFMFILIAVVFIVGALTFFPVLTLGPILEHLLMVG